MPLGFYYRRSPEVIHRGDIVAVCLPSGITQEGLNQHYLVQGSCQHASMPVAKQIVAILGDTVKLTQQAIIVNGVSYPAPHQFVDHNGKPVKQFIRFGTYHSTGYWLYGSHDYVHSWDSRYYGRVSRENIIGVYRPLVTF